MSKNLFIQAGYINEVDPLVNIILKDRWHPTAAPAATVMEEDGFIVSAPGSVLNLEYGELEFTKENLDDLATLSTFNT